MSSTDEATRRAALTRLAIATKELIPEDKPARDAWFQVHLDGLASFHTTTVVEVCRRLETTAEDGWFPKLPVLCEAMRAYVRRKMDEAKPVYQLNGPALDPEKLKTFRADVALALERKRMR